MDKLVMSQVVTKVTIGYGRAVKTSLIKFIFRDFVPVR